MYKLCKTWATLQGTITCPTKKQEVRIIIDSNVPFLEKGICDRSQKGISARIWKPTIQRTLQFWWGDWYMRLVSVSELVYCNDFSYTVMHTLFIWFFTSQIIHRHKSTCKRCWDLQNSSISKTPSSKTIPHCFPNKPSWSASHLVFQDTFEGLHVILLGDSFSQMFADVCHCFLQLHGLAIWILFLITKLRVSLPLF